MKDLINYEKYPAGLISMQEAIVLMDQCSQFMRVGPMFMGWTLNEIVKKELYKQINYDNFEDFIDSDEFGYGRSQAYNWIKAYETFKDIDNVQRLDKLGIRKLLAISAVKDIQDRRELIKQASTMTVKEVEEKVKQTKRLSQNIDNQVSPGDSQLIKFRRIGKQLLEKATELIKYQEIFNNQFKEDLNNINLGLNKWIPFINQESDEELNETKNKLLNIISKLEELK